MKIPWSWVRDFVDPEAALVDVARRMTLGGLEVKEIRFVGLPLPADSSGSSGSAAGRRETAISGLEWDPVKIVVGEIREVMPHPNADRLVLCRLFDGNDEHTVLTGAPNLFDFTGEGPLGQPLKVAFAKEGARLYDGHQPGWQATTLKRAKIRGVESYSMVCSEKELGISEDHEGIIVLDNDATVGQSLVDYMGDAVLDIDITPNIARDANILGVAREVAALTGAELHEPSYEVDWHGPELEGRASLEIRDPELNPRFVLGLIEGIEIKPSPYWVQRRLRLAGMRPINNIVDATNYTMLEIGEPLHAFDYDVLVKRAGGEAPHLLTRHAEAGEVLTTLDGEDRNLDEFTVLVADTAGALSIAGVMGGLESEVSEATTRVLLEGAAWNFINIRKTLASQKMSSEAAYRFSRGVHPAMAELGVRSGLTLMKRLAGGKIAQGLIDNYPLPPEPVEVEIGPEDVRRWIGIELSVEDIADILTRLQFSVRTLEGNRMAVTSPDHRLDIGSGTVGRADLMEEIARIYGYDRIPETLLADPLPPQLRNRPFELEEKLRDLLVDLGLQEVVTYRMTTPEREALSIAPDWPADERPYVELANPISSELTVMRHELLPNVLSVLQTNRNVRNRITVFELGPVFVPVVGEVLPDEPNLLAIAMAGPRVIDGWSNDSQATPMDFFDIKGLVTAMFDGMHLQGFEFRPAEGPSFHPGKSAEVLLEGERVGMLGELHPLVAANYDLTDWPVVAAALDVDAFLPRIPERYVLDPIPAYPPVLEDLALVVGSDVPAATVARTIRQAGGDLVAEVRLFDLYEGEQIAPGKKSLAYSVVYQAADRTLTDDEVGEVRNKIIRAVEDQLGGELRG